MDGLPSKFGAAGDSAGALVGGGESFRRTSKVVAVVVVSKHRAPAGIGSDPPRPVDFSRFVVPWPLAQNLRNKLMYFFANF